MWSQLIWLDPANWSGRPLFSPDSSSNETEVDQSPENVETISVSTSDTEEDVPSSERNEYDFLDDINNEIEEENNISNGPVVDLQDSNNDIEDTNSGIEGSWDIASHLPAAASIYFRHTLGTSSLIKDFNFFPRSIFSGV